MSYRRWIFIAIFVFGIGLVCGSATPTSIASLISEDIDALKEISSILVPFSALTVLLIFIKNASVILLSFVLSPIFCLIPILTLTINGWMIAFVSTAVIQEESFSYLLAGLLPHGIFELPALIIAQAAALSFGIMAILAMVKREKRSLFLPSLKQNIKYLLIALALLVPAAIIETYVTPLLLT